MYKKIESKLHNATLLYNPTDCGQIIYDFDSETSLKKGNTPLYSYNKYYKIDPDIICNKNICFILKTNAEHMPFYCPSQAFEPHMDLDYN